MSILIEIFGCVKYLLGFTSISIMGIFDEFFEKAKSLLGESEKETAPKKRCYYELLEVDRDATEDEIKKAYRKLALKWHPDKNPDKQEECKAYFVLLQQAYDVLIDPQERAFYDKHRENIIHGGEGGSEETRDEGIVLYPYFSTCYKGYGDDKDGFYAVYRELFDKLAAEEYAYLDEDERDFPSFGKLDSDYEKVVYKFYAFWMDFHTSRSFAWLDKYNLMQAPDRRTARYMEKENDKLREVGRKNRNDEVQELVRYVRKRDPRVKRYRETIELRRQEQLQKVEQTRLQQLKENLERLGEYKIDEHAHQAHMEALDEIEDALDAEFGVIRQKVAAGSDASDEEDEEDYTCVACDKTFKSSKAFSNHQKSKKHKQAVEELKKFMKEEDAALVLGEEPSNSDVADEEMQQGLTKSKKKRKKQRENGASNGNSKLKEGASNLARMMDYVDIVEPTPEPTEKIATKKEKRKTKQNDHPVTQSTPSNPSGPVESKCDACGETFESRSKLFKHLELTGHATLKTVPTSGSKKNKKGKK